MARVRVFLAVLFLLFTSSPVHGADNGSDSVLESVPDLEKAMYLNLKSYPCVRLLNLLGEIGCSNPGNDKISAPIVRLKSGTISLARPSTVLLQEEQMQDFFLRVSGDMEFSKNVAGVLVEPSETVNMSSGFSPADKFPQSAFAPYSNTSYEWNLPGSGIMWNKYDFPVFLLAEESISTLKEIVGEGNEASPENVAEFDLVMQTTKLGTHDSETCLKDQTCLPLGGYSVWSSLPPINISSTVTKPIVFAVASFDSASFFRDRSLGADSPISGLIALLTAVDALSHVNHLKNLKKQLVFAVLTGEAWGYLGSRKFLQELDLGSDSIRGLSSSMIEQIVEIGSVGQSLGKGGTLFYAHAGGESSGTKVILKALEDASESLGSDNVKVKKASSMNPGIPPSSLMAFLRKNTSASGIVLGDFDSAFSNKFYHSHLDNACKLKIFFFKRKITKKMFFLHFYQVIFCSTTANIKTSSVAAAAALVARALYIIANGDATLDLMALNDIKVNVSLVEELVGCLVTCEPGLSCELVGRYISPSNGDCPSHYVGVFQDTPSASQKPSYVDDTSRFLWNFLADMTSATRDGTDSCTGDCSNVGDVCIGSETEGGGKCVISTTRYVPAYSTRLKYENNIWHVLPANPSDPMESVDPVWTESYWNTIGLRVYKVESPLYDRLVLAGGVFVTFASYLAVVIARTQLAKVVKRD
ncbi:Nicastrin [Rhynchospora pubera]|uniref:Nicastrin n=1 Tax=Rhynchospora pubera TaxID=906938 RepID=A0AAV8D801_9POAL|nr:Nicastrin [Rhynchospora pubera]